MIHFNKLPFYDASRRTMTYAGIGSRNTPIDMLVAMTLVASELSEMGYTLNTGDAQGADTAFREGSDGHFNIFCAHHATGETREIAKEIHPAPRMLKSLYVLNLMARNTNQIFGADLDTPVDFVLCWTPDGAESHHERSRTTGGTGQAISMANLKGIPVINMNRPGWESRLNELLEDN